MKTHIITLLWCCFSIIGFGQSITDVEYFFNTDPGFGNATPLTVNANTGSVTQTVSLPVGNTLTGFNTLYVRAKNNANTWSLYDNRVFYISTITTGNTATIAAAEYFFNTDPGIGNATPIATNVNTGSVTQTVALPVNALTGFNTIYIRTKDNLGTWSLYDTRTFYISQFAAGEGASNIAAAEYFINTDPGFGNATPINVNTNTGNLTQVLSLPIGTLQGFNTLYIRTKDNLGVWSIYDSRLFYIRSDSGIVIPNIVAAEYFYDADPGFGNGTVATITPTANPNEFTIELATTNVSCDFHDFYIRLKNSEGKWSLYDYREDIEVYDNANPTIVVFPNITAELNASGQASITIANVDNGTFDDCELTSVVLNQTQFNYTCANLGANTVTVTATDAEAKVSNQNVTISVVDLINPVAITQNITVPLDASGQATITPAQINNGSTDNCTIASSSLNISNFTCANLGSNTVTLTVTDSSGNIGTNNATVTVVDNINPVAITKPVTVQLNASGNATITANDVDNNSTDNCGITSKSLNVSSFTCANLGANTVMLTVQDASGNMHTTSATVTVVDLVNPIVITKNITVPLNASGNATITPSQVENGSSDNCAIANSNLNVTNFTCSNLGSNSVTLSVTDSSGNTGTNTATVTIVDNINPVAITKPVTVLLNASGNATITANDVDNNSTDNCGITSKSLNVSSFTCANLGSNTVMLTVQDASGNMHTTSATVTVIDLVNPTVITKNITVPLNTSGNATITPSQVENGSSDNCAIANSNLNITNFTCANLGNNTVTLSVTDTSGNTGTNTATVNVVDNINPVAIGQDITRDLAGNLSLTITASDINNGSSDNCNFTLSLDIYTFNTIGVYPVVLTITDIANNTNTVMVSVTIIDSSLGIDDNELSSKNIKLYPVPTDDYIHISTKLIIQSLTIFNLNGRLIRNIVSPSNTINVSDLSAGVYFLKFDVNDVQINKRIVKK